MIDFRYHLVSIVSIFLALAVGIVLGAGPLQQQIGSTLTSEVTQLRKDKADLRSQVDAAHAAVTSRDAFIDSALPLVVSGSLTGRTVAVIVLPGVDASLADRSVQTLTAAGARIGARVGITDAWLATDTRTVAAREAAVTRAAALLHPGRIDDGHTNVTIDGVFAASLVTPNGVLPDEAAMRAALTEFVAAKLVDTDPTLAVPATAALVIAPPPTSASSDAKAAATAWVALAQALRTGGSGAVLGCDSGSGSGKSVDPVSVVGRLRDDPSARAAVSTVDNAGVGVGQVSLAYALAGQLQGVVGHFGSDTGAQAPYPPLPVQ